MFNEVIKNDFINTISEGSVIVTKNIFKKTESYEIELDKDISKFNSNEILDFYKLSSKGSANTITNMHSILKKYTNYCIQRNLVPDMMNHFMEIDNVLIYNTCENKVIIDNKIMTRKELLETLETLKNPSDKFLCLALFEGIGGKNYIEFKDISSKNLLDDNYILLNTGRKLKISDELVKYIIDSTNEYTYYVTINGVEDEKEFIETDTGCFKRRKTKKSIGKELDYYRLIFLRMTQLSKKLDNPIICAKGIQNSGMIHTLNKIKKEKGLKTYYAFNDSEFIDRFGKYNNKNTFIYRYEEYLE